LHVDMFHGGRMKISSLLPLCVLMQFLAFMTTRGREKVIKKTVVSSPVKHEMAKELDLVTIDAIVAIIYGDEETYTITKSDLDRPGIDGRYRSLDDRIMEALLYGEAKKYKMLPTNEAVEKHLQAVQQEHNLTKEELYNIFRAAGYTPGEGKEQFAHLSAISSLMDFKIRSRLIVPEKDIVAYYDENPVWEDPSYQLQRAIVPIPKKKDAKEFEKELEQFIKIGMGGSIRIRWDDLFWIKQDDIAEVWSFIMDMKIDEIRFVQAVSEGLELVKLTEKREKCIKSLEERYREIADILRRPKYEELLAKYKNSLLEVASIVYFKE